MILYIYIYIYLRKYRGSLSRQTKKNAVNSDFLPKGHLITINSIHTKLLLCSGSTK